MPDVIVGVMGSGSDPWPDRAGPLGRWLAEIGVHLLTGGGGGVMASVSKAFAETPGRSGRVIGILPGDASGRPPAGYPNPWVEITIRTHLPLSGARGTSPMSRNHLNILSSDVIVALPGSAGTASEIQLARVYGKPLVAYVAAGSEFPDLPAGTPAAGGLAEVQRFVLGRIEILT